MTDTEYRWANAASKFFKFNDFSHFMREIAQSKVEEMNVLISVQSEGPQGRPNPDFREDWQAIHDDASERRNVASSAENAFLRRLPNLSEEERKEMHARQSARAETHSLCLRCLDVYQHRTFEDTLAWLNRTFCSDDPIIIDSFDIQKFDDVPAMITAVYRAYSQRRDAEEIKENLLPLAIPEDFEPFSDAARCKRLDLTIPSNRWWPQGYRVLFLTNKVNDVLHVAMQSGKRQNSVVNSSEALINEFLCREVPEWTKSCGWVSWFKSTEFPKFKFYTYIEPTKYSFEMFDLVELSAPLSPGKPISVAQWHALGSVPSVIRPKSLPDGLADWDVITKNDD